MTLNLTIYKPNLKDSRTKARITSVLEWCSSMRMSPHAIRLHNKKLLEIFGNRSRGLGRWLDANLLSRVGHYTPGKTSFSYRLKQTGYVKLHAMLDSALPTEIEIVKKKFAMLIDGSKKAEYLDKGGRRYHPAQNVKRELRKLAFSGWWDYDIECAAPSLVYQFAVNAHRQIYPGIEEVELYPTVRALIDDKEMIRAHIAELTGLKGQEVKELISALFFRANTAPFHKARVYSLLGCDIERHQKLLNDSFVKEFRSDVKHMWFMARFQDNVEHSRQRFLGKKTTDSPSKKVKHQMKIYLMLERQVMDEILKQVETTSTKSLLMHDGFMSQDRMDTAALVEVVRKNVGMTIRLSESHLGADVDVSSDEPDIVRLLRGDKGEN